MATETPLSDLQEREGRSDSPSIGQAASENTEISLLDLLIVLGERKRMVLWITASFTIVAIVVSFLLPKRYTATVILLPPQQNSSISAALNSQLGALTGVAALAGGSGLNLKN